MSVIARIRVLLPKIAALPWGFAETLQAGKPLIAQVVKIENAEAATVMVNATPAWLELYDVTVRMRTRLKSGKSAVLASDRNALYAALAKLEGP